MIDSKLIVMDLEESIRKLERKSVDKNKIKKLQQLILEKNKLISEVELLRAKRKKLSQEVGALMAKKETEKAEQIKQEVSGIKEQIQNQEKQLESSQSQIKNTLLHIPNFPDDKVPFGTDSKSNKVTQTKNYDPTKYEGLDIPPHWEIMESLNIFDQARASKITGSMFAILKGSGSQLLRSLVSFAYEVFQQDYLELTVPSVVNSSAFTGTGHLPKFAEDAYHIEKDDLWLIPTGEVPLTALHKDEILNEKQLPLKYMTYTSCFRKEAGAAGKETRGLQRLHEFHKVELVKLCKPENSAQELESLLQDTLKPIQLLKLPYRILELCTGDLTFSSSRTFDIEVYSPGTKQWLEVCSASLFTDFQARRSQIRYRTSNNQTQFVHTINGSGLATPRIMAAILENYWQKDGKVKVPEVLQKYMANEFLT